MPLDEGTQVFVVRDDGRDVARHVTAAPAVEQIGQAVVLPADEQHHPLVDIGVGDLPLHGELCRHRLEQAPEFVRAEGQALRGHLDAEKEQPRAEVAVLRRLEHRATVAGDESGDGGDDADAVGARDGQDVAAHVAPFGPQSSPYRCLPRPERVRRRRSRPRRTRRRVTPPERNREISSMARKPISAGPAASGRMRLAMIRSSWLMRSSECMPMPDAQLHGVGIRDHAHEGPGHLVIRPVRGLQLAVVLVQRRGPLAAERMSQRGGGQSSGLVAVGDALAVEGVDGSGGVARQNDVGAGPGPDGEAHGELAAGRGTEAGLGGEAPGLRAPTRRRPPSGARC